MTRTHRLVSRLFQRTALAAALSLCVLSSAQALTLGRPLVQSKQGEALLVEIDVAEISLAEQQELQATLASPEVYRAAKMEVPTVNGTAMDLQVELLRRENGRPFLRVTSKQAVQSKALDLLIDLRWASGRLMRDISLSIDDSKASKAVAKPAYLGEQITVQRGDTASELAAPATPQGVSLDQMLVALLRMNPDAFVDDNVNRMKAGALLKLPTEAQARAISKEEARREIRVQAKDFEAYRAELAARAPGGKVATASRDATGKLDAKVENKSLQGSQDKLTLAKSGQNNNADKIAKQREAQEVASRAAEISRNIAELGQIAAATAASDASSDASPAVAAEVPASAVDKSSASIEELLLNPDTPVYAAGLIASLLLIALWRRRAQTLRSDENIQGLPPLNVKFDLDLPQYNEPVDDSRDARVGHTEAFVTHSTELHEHPHAHDEAVLSHHAEPHLSDELHHAPLDVPHADSTQAVRPTLDIPNISLDLEEPPVNDHPFQVRMDLADELWKLGQLHTSRALMEEVANEATGDVKEKALQWLAERG